MISTMNYHGKYNTEFLNEGGHNPH